MNLISLKNNSKNQIILHIFIWFFFILVSLMQFYESPFKIGNDFFVQWATGILLFYLNYYYFVPNMLLQKKDFEYFTVLIVLITIFMVIRSLYFIPEFKEIVHPKMFDATGKEIIENKIFPKKKIFFFELVPAIFYLLIVAISTIIRILSEYFNNQQHKLSVESQRTTAELIYLRKQTNPHFLFNTLNSIYSLAHKKSDLVPDAIVTLSELMRYMLYETDNKTVLLEKEINYIQNYIELQKLRLNNIENIYVNIHGETKNKFIEPLLLISFIENAFKYGTDYKGNTHVKIKIVIEENNLDFWVENRVEKNFPDPENSGIGISNIKNRLKLLYPDSHILTIEENDKNYLVHLNLKLDQIQTIIDKI
ncbi:MAG: sensor histidine kinase [Flavobacterium sp.]|uniref:sensor histidine kinase n=1 Tax=Flavobacterium sp. TaxID=239 RepID=UPI00261B040E|nr:sensor histidine kinase [Flavobacterium sp.]MDD5149241.1 sensor histidine kinase [Flavobacterium sp.]